MTVDTNFRMTLDPNHHNNSNIWQGDEWSDLVFIVSSFKIPSSTLGLRVYLELTKAGEETKEMVPCREMNFSGRPQFIFDSKERTAMIGQEFSAELSSLCDFLFNDKCLVGVTVHRDVLVGSTSLSLHLIVAIKSNKAFSPTMAHCDDAIVDLLRIDSSNEANIALDEVNVLSFRSKEVKIAKYKLCIQEKFSRSEYTQRRKDVSPQTFEWFNRHGGNNVSIDVIVHLKDSKGLIVHDYPTSLPLKTELLYDDGSPVPMYPLMPVKTKSNSISSKRKATKNEDIKLFNPTRPNPILGVGNGSQYFSFRIEEVSSNHDHKGFKLKVSPLNESSDVFHGVLEETIIVKAKPLGLVSKRSKGGRKSILNDNDIADKGKSKKIASKEKIQPRKVTVDDITKSYMFDKEMNTVTMNLSTATSMLTGCSGNQCLACGEAFEPGKGLCPSHHKSDCRFNMTMVPFILCGTNNNSSTVNDFLVNNYKDGIIEIDGADYGRGEAAESLLALSGINDIFNE